MGLFRKITAVSTLGAVNHRSPRERIARSAEIEAKANAKAARAQARLLDAERRALEAQQD